MYTNTHTSESNKNTLKNKKMFISSQITPLTVSPPRPTYFRPLYSVFLSIIVLITATVVCFFFFPPPTLVDYGAVPSTLTSCRTFIIRVG